MKLVRVGAPGQERPGLIDSDGKLRDLSGVISDVAGEHITNAGHIADHAAQVAEQRCGR